MKKITILLVEDHQIVRQGLRGLLELDTVLEVIGEASDGRQAVEMAKTLHPDVILMDIAMPLLNGLEATRAIVLDNPEAKILILTAHRDEAYIDRALAAGAVGFLLKQTSAEKLYQAIRNAHAGKRNIVSGDKSSGEKSSHSSISSQRLRSVPATRSLTARESQVLQLVAEGMANKAIARVLGISIKTVEKHREHLMRKLKIHDTAGLTRYSISAGIIESSVQSTIASPETEKPGSP